MKELTDLGDAIKFVNEAYRHCKTIGAIGNGIELLKASVIRSLNFKENSTNSALGIVIDHDKSDFKEFFQMFKDAISKHRHWEREEKDKNQIPA